MIRITGQSTYGDSMEMVLYNTILGAKPIQADGRSFYYADYNNNATKFFHQDKWPCCSGTFPQITADYGISSYFRAPGAVYVNLFVPSRVHWRQGGAIYALEQQTEYPLVPVTTLRVVAPRPATFSVHLRVPAWAGRNTVVRVNGKPFALDLEPGTFAALHREWKDGDTIEYSLEMSVYLKAIDPKNPDIVALMQGPLTLFAVNNLQASYSRAQLLAATQKVAGGSEWTVEGSGGPVIFRPFFAIDQEH